MNIPYRTRRVLRNIGIITLSLAVLAVSVWLIWMLWLDRFVVYTRDGAVLDFNSSAEDIRGEIAVPPETKETVAIYYNDGENAINTSTDLTQIYGYYVDSTTLQERDLEEIIENIKDLPKGTTVLLDVKNIYGALYYSSSMGPESDEVDIAAMDQLISYLRTSGIYTVARVSAFCDYHYVLKYDTYGLPHIDGGYIWADDNYCYWMNPDNPGTLNYLINIVAELKGLGFNEVVFDQFRFPDTDMILYDGDKVQSLTNAAATLVANCASETFAVSFISNVGAFTLPTGRTRLYVDDAAAAQAATIATDSGLADPAVMLVFITTSKDTRFDEYGVLRPITAGNFDND